VVDDVVASMEDEKFDDREDRHLSWTPLMLDEQAWTKMQKLLDDTLKQVLKINAEATKRLAKSKDEGISASVAMIGYEVPDSASKKLPKRKAKGAAAKKAKAKKAKAKRK
jgi:hypothetical protein